MNCKNCNVQLKEGVTICPNCGKNNRCLWKRILAAFCAVVLLAVVVCAALYGFGIVDFGIRENNAQYKGSYTVSDKKALNKSNVIIAVAGGKELTNGDLQIYYSMEAIEFITEYSEYLSYLNLDYQKPLDKQYYSKSQEITWQQKFLDGALNTWHLYTMMNLAAQDEGYVFDDDLKQTIAKLSENLEELAKENNYRSADEMIREDFGGACTVEAYLRYLENYYKGIAYLGSKYDIMTPTQQEIEDYFTKNQKTLEESGIKKTSGKYVDVRHILIQPKGGTKDEDGNVTYTQAEWDTCYASAKAVLEEWLAGAATEDSFAELANKYSEDPGSNTKGGLYTQVASGKMVEAFDEWIFDENRGTGDYGIVKTEHGYHIMYFVDSEDIWISEVRNMIVSDRADAYLKEIEKRYPIQVTYKNIVLGKLSLT